MFFFTISALPSSQKFLADPGKAGGCFTSPVLLLKFTFDFFPALALLLAFALSLALELELASALALAKKRQKSFKKWQNVQKCQNIQKNANKLKQIQKCATNTKFTI